MTLLRVELRRLLARRTIRVLAALFLTLIAVVMLGNYLSADAAQPLTSAFVHDSGVGFGGGFSVVAFLTGATAGGAEWAARSIETVLLWEPRRVRLMLAKAAVLVATVVAAAVVVQLLVAGLSRAAVAGEGSMAGAEDGFWSTYTGNAATAVALAALATLLGFAIAGLTRNTGFALGAGFVYAAVIDRLLTLLPNWIEPFTLSNNIGAFVNHGITLYRDDGGTATTLSTGRAGVTLVLYVAAVFAAAAALFRRRDVT